MHHYSILLLLLLLVLIFILLEDSLLKNNIINSHQRCPIKKGLRPATLLKKETLAQVFSYEFCEIFRNTFFTEHLWTTASAIFLSIFYTLDYVKYQWECLPQLQIRWGNKVHWTSWPHIHKRLMIGSCRLCL